MFSHKFEHSMSTPHYCSLRLILLVTHMGLSENSVPLNPMVNEHFSLFCARFITRCMHPRKEIHVSQHISQCTGVCFKDRGVLRWSQRILFHLVVVIWKHHESPVPEMPCMHSQRHGVSDETANFFFACSFKVPGPNTGSLSFNARSNDGSNGDDS